MMKKSLIGQLEEETAKLTKECNDLIDRLEASYTDQQSHLMEKIDNLLNSIYHNKKKLGRIYLRREITSSIKSTNEDSREKYKAYVYEQIRQEYPRAYALWTQEEDNQLRQKYAEIKSIVTLAQIFQRKPGAIRSRLKRLGLIQYFNPQLEKDNP
jgi:hypothetical protein